MPIHVPDDPETYLRAFLPEQFSMHRRHFPKGDTAAATRFRVMDTGAWCLQVENDALLVTPAEGVAVALELACTLDDFHALFVGYVRDEVARTGELSEGALAALRPLVLTDRKLAACKRTRRTLALELKYGRSNRRLLVTPGGGAPTEPASTVCMSFDNYLLLQTGRRSAPRLFFTRKLKIKGDLKHAVRLDPLLG